MEVRATVEVIKQQVPVLGQCHQPGTDHVIGGDAGERLHGVVPHQDFTVLAHGAGRNRQVLKGLAVMPAQVVQLAGQAGQSVLVVAEGAFYIADVLGSAALGHGLEAEMALDHVPGYGGAEQARQVYFHLVAQSPELVRPILHIGQFQLAQCPFHFSPRHTVAQRLR